jgi:hypothetical protein
LFHYTVKTNGYLIYNYCKFNLCLIRDYCFHATELGEIILDDTVATELDTLRRILHFPEEVALLISNKENDLFYDVPPLDFLRQVTLDQDGTNVCNTSVKKLIDRFNAVCSTYLNIFFVAMRTC